MASAGWPKLTARPSTSIVPCGGAAVAGQNVEQLVLPLAFQRHDAQHLALMQIKRNVGEPRSGFQPAHAQPGCDASLWTRRLRPRFAHGLGHRPAQHQLDDALFNPRLNREVAHRRAVAQHGGAVADRGDFGEAVRNVDDGAARIRLLAHDFQHPVDEVGRQGGGHLVEQQHIRLGGKRAGKIEDAQRRQRQAADQVVHAQIMNAKRVHPMPERFGRRVAEAQIVGHIKVGDQRRLLIDRHQPGAARVCGRGGEPVEAFDAHMAAIRLQRAGEDFDKGRFARAVRAHQGDDLALGRPAARRRAGR